MRCAIETCRSQWKCFSVNNFRLIYDIKLVHLLVCSTQWIFKMHGATIKIFTLYFHVRLQKSRWFLIRTFCEEMYAARLNTNDDGVECVMKLKFTKFTNKKWAQKNDLEVPVRNCRTRNVKYVHPHCAKRCFATENRKWVSGTPPRGQRRPVRRARDFAIFMYRLSRSSGSFHLLRSLRVCPGLMG
jgi:hypothetical protein